MAAAGFGRKGVATGEAMPVRRRAAFLVAPEARTGAPANDDIESKREAFLAAERARGEDAPERGKIEAALAAFKAEAAPLKPPTDRSLKLAWPIWFLLGLAGGHRFYLRKPITGALQAAICLGCIGAVALGYYPAFAGLGLSWLWYLSDGLRMQRLFLAAGRDAA